MMDEIMTVMDVFPTLVEATAIDAGEHFPWDGKSLWGAISEGEAAPRTDDVFFASETPIYGHFNLTLFNDEWKLVQLIVSGLSSVEITNSLFRIEEDPYEYNNLAEEHPEVVAEFAKAIHQWRMLYPVSGTRHELVPPPGWRAPRDWASYPKPIAELQPKPARGMPPEGLAAPLDWQHGEVGRLIYDCEPYPLLGGGLCK